MSINNGGASAPLFNVVLLNPEIPGNTGSIGRTCVALNIRLHLIHPLGFDLDEKAVRRAGLDYWKHVDLVEHKSWDNFLNQENIDDLKKLIFYSRFNQDNVYYKAPYQKDCYLIFGSETKGLPADILEQYQEQTYALPMFSEHIRSLNLANTVTTAAYEALRYVHTF
jgi:tRNA (cytidine/uridine-2'-O-)-methyltransferase